jgi:UDP-glucuronate 4-epimerase
MEPPVLVTGAAGFIGFHVARRFLAEGRRVIGLDNLNDYYDVGLKEARLARLQQSSQFQFARMDLCDIAGVNALFTTHRFEIVIHLAAQAGVRYSLENPHAYVSSNVAGFLTILEACRHQDVRHLIYASSSSVYGAGTKMPFSVDQNVDHPFSVYAATKKSNELFAHTYSHLYGLPTTGLRFFTVYGPWGRPDMAYFLFTRAIMEGETINIFNNGDMQRDFTYVDDVIEAIRKLADRIPAPNPDGEGMNPHSGSSRAPYRIYNIGNHTPVKLMHFIEVIENSVGRRAKKKFLPMQPGDVPSTYADVDDLARDVGFAPSTPIEVGVKAFVRWYQEFYRPRESK